MDGGQELSFDELYPVSVFPADISYLGSPFYFAHASGQGEGDEAADFSRTEGTWVLSGEGGGLLTLMLDGQGYFTAIHRDGQEISGYLEYVDEYGDGNGRYDMYDSEGTFLQGFTFDSDDQIHVGNDEGTEYVRHRCGGGRGFDSYRRVCMHSRIHWPDAGGHRQRLPWRVLLFGYDGRTP